MPRGPKLVLIASATATTEQQRMLRRLRPYLNHLYSILTIFNAMEILVQFL